jgi:hypothetical protein
MVQPVQRVDMRRRLDQPVQTHACSVSPFTAKLKGGDAPMNLDEDEDDLSRAP